MRRFSGLTKVVMYAVLATLIVTAIAGPTVAHGLWGDLFHTLGQLIGHHSVPSISVKK